MKAAFPFARARTFLLLLTLLFAVGCRGSYVVTGDPQALGDVAVGAPAAAEVVITATSPNTIVGSFGVESEQNCVVTTTLPVEFQPGAPGDLRLANGEVERIPVTLTPLGPGPFCGTFFAPEDSREAGQTSDIADPEHSTTICGNAVAGVGALELSVEDKQTVVAGDEGTYTLVATNVSDSVITITGASVGDTTNSDEATVDTSALPLDIAPNDQAQFPSAFYPDVEGTYSLELTVTWSSEGLTNESTLTVDGETGDAISRFTSAALSELGSAGTMTRNLGCAPVNVTSQQDLLIANEGDALLRVTDATVDTGSLTNLELGVTATPTGALDTGESAVIGLALKPLNAGQPFSGTVNVTTNEGLTFAFNLLGDASESGPFLVTDVLTLLGAHTQFETAAVPLSNHGSQDLTITEIDLIGSSLVHVENVEIADTPPLVIPACGSTNLNVAYRPICFGDCGPNGTIDYPFGFSVSLTHDGAGSGGPVLSGQVTGPAPAVSYLLLDLADSVLTHDQTITTNPATGLDPVYEAIAIQVPEGELADLQLQSLSFGSSTTATIAVESTNPAGFVTPGMIGRGLDFEQEITFVITPLNAGGTFTQSVTFDVANGASKTINFTGTSSGGDLLGGGAQSLGDIPVGTQGTATLDLENGGNADLTVSGLTLDSTSNATVTINPPAFPIVIPPGGQSSVDLDVTPTIAGSTSAQFSVASDDADTPVTIIVLNGTGTEPDIDVPAVPAASGFIGDTVTSTIVVNNTGTADLEVTGVTVGIQTGVVATPLSPPTAQSPLTIPAGGSATLPVDLLLTGIGPVGINFAPIAITSNDPDEPVVNIVLDVGITDANEFQLRDPANAIVPTPHTETIASSVVGAPVETTFVAENIGTLDLNITNAVVGSCTNCTVTTSTLPPSTIAGFVPAPFGATVTPDSAGAWSYTITFDTDDSDEPSISITVQGTAVDAPELEVSVASTTIVDGGSASLGSFPAVGQTSFNAQVDLTNTGSTTLEILSLAQTPGTNEATTSNQSGTPLYAIAPGQTQQVTVSFDPAAPGLFDFALTITTNEPADDTYAVGFTGLGTGGVLDMLATLDLGTVIIGDQVDATVPYTNQGTEPLQVFDVNATIGSRFANCAPQTTLPVDVAPGGSGNVVVRCDVVNPAGAGAFDIFTSTTDPNAPSFTTSVTATVEAPAPEIAISRAGNDIPDGTNDALPLGGAPGAVVLDTWTVTNSGTGPLTVTEPTFDNELNCTAVLFSPLGTASIAPNASASFTLAITPSGVGSHAWAFDLELLNDDADEATFDITVSGGVYDPPVFSTPASAAMGDIPTGQVSTASITVVNLGGDPGTISSIVVDTPTNGAATLNPAPNLPLTIAGGASTTINVDVTPAADGAVSTNVVIDSDDPNAPQITVPLTANGVSPEINVRRAGSTVASGATDQQGTVNVGTTQTVTYTVENVGTADLSVSTPTFSNLTNVSTPVLTANPASPVAASANTTFTFTYSVGSAGAYSFDVTVPNNDADEGTYTFTVIGTGSGPEIEVQIDGAVAVDTSTVTVSGAVTNQTTVVQAVISNTGTAPLTVTSTTIAGPVNATIGSGGPSNLTLAPGASLSFSIDITPTIPGVFSGDLVIESDDFDEATHLVTLSGTAVGTPDIDLQFGALYPNTLNPAGPTVSVGLTGTFTYTIANTGDDVLVVNSITTTAPNSCTAQVVTPTPLTIAAGASAQVDIDVTPTSTAGAGYFFTVVTTSNDPNESPINTVVFGDPSAAQIDAFVNGTPTPAGGTYEIGDLLVGTTASLAVRLESGGNIPLTIQSTTVGAGSNASLNIPTGPAASIAQGANDIFTAIVTANGLGTFSVPMTIVNNDDDEDPYVITFIGIGVAPEVFIGDPAGQEIPDGGSHSLSANVPIGASSISFDINNQNGSGVLGVSGVSFSNQVGCTVAASGVPSTVAAGQFSSFQVQVTTVGPGQFSFDMTVTNTDLDEGTYTVSIVGTAGGEPEIDLQFASTSYASGGVLDLGVVVEGETTPVEVDVANLGTGLLNVFAPTIVGPTNVAVTVNGFPASVAAGTSGLLDMDIVPGTPGGFSYQVSLGNDDPNEDPYLLTITGTVVSDFSCQGLPEFAEVEPNDGFQNPPNDVTALSLPGGDFCISGEQLCGNFFYPDEDTFEIEFPTTASRTFTLMWQFNGDNDLDVFDQNNNSVISFQFGFVGPEVSSATFNANESYFIQVGCFEGQPANGPWYLLIEN